MLILEALSKMNWAKEYHCDLQLISPTYIDYSNYSSITVCLRNLLPGQALAENMDYVSEGWREVRRGTFTCFQYNISMPYLQNIYW